MSRQCAVVIAVFLFAAHPMPSRGAIVFGQRDDFQDGTTKGWTEGFSTPNAPETVPTGGPRGAGDAFLENVSVGVFGAGSRQVMFNQGQWTGDYSAAGVNRISGWAVNFGATPLHLRVALAGGNSQFGSTRAVDLAADGVWRRVSFDLTDAAMTRIQGTQDLAGTLSAVTELRLLSAQGGPSFRGDGGDATLGVDNLRAMRPEGDANFDGAINNADLSLVRANLGTAAGATWARGDFNFDGRVNAVDVALLRRNLNTSGGPGFSAAMILPEPLSLAPSGLLAALLLRRRREA